MEMRENSHAPKNCRASAAPPPHSLPHTRRITSISAIPWSSRTNWTRDAATASSRRYSSAAPSRICASPCPLAAATVVPSCGALSRRRSGRASTRYGSSRMWATPRGPRQDGAGMISPRPDGGAPRVPDPWRLSSGAGPGLGRRPANDFCVAANVLIRKNTTKPVADPRNAEATTPRPFLYWKGRDRRKDIVVLRLKNEKKITRRS